MVELEVTVFYCRENATVASPECEQQVLEAVLEPMMQSQAVLEEWQRAGAYRAWNKRLGDAKRLGMARGWECHGQVWRQWKQVATRRLCGKLRGVHPMPQAVLLRLLAGIKSAEVLSIQQRQPPPAPATSVPASLDPWVPWHLDRLDQHNQPLDGKCTATATGKGVHIYLLSSVSGQDSRRARWAC